MSVQWGCSERGPEVYSVPYVADPRDVRTTLSDVFSILLMGVAVESNDELN